MVGAITTEEVSIVAKTLQHTALEKQFGKVGKKWPMKIQKKLFLAALE